MSSAAEQARAASPEQTRARYPDQTGYVERDGIKVFWERYGDGEPTVLLLPTWSIVHSRRWKAQIPYLARHYRVLTFDPRGNGRSDRPEQVAAYEQASALLAELGHEVEDVTLPLGADVVPFFETLWCSHATLAPIDSSGPSSLVGCCV